MSVRGVAALFVDFTAGVPGKGDPEVFRPRACSAKSIPRQAAGGMTVGQRKKKDKKKVAQKDGGYFFIDSGKSLIHKMVDTYSFGPMDDGETLILFSALFQDNHRLVIRQGFY